jgi:tight adherence protein C
VVELSAQALGLGLTLGLGLWTLMGVLWPVGKKTTMAHAIASHLVDISPVARTLQRQLEDNPLSVAGYILSPSLRGAVGRLDRLLGGRETQVAPFEASGRPESFDQFRQHRAAQGLLCASGGAVVGLALGAATANLAVLWGLIGATVGLIAAIGLIDYRVRQQAKMRAERVSEEFPTIIELLGLALAAGDSLPRALARVSHRASGELGREWARVMAAVDVGAPLGESLRRSALRVGSPRVVAFVEHLAQALERGAPLAEVVAAHSVDAKADYSRSLVEKAGKAEVRMLVPMVLLILPITVIFAVYPGLEALRFEF